MLFNNTARIMIMAGLLWTAAAGAAASSDGTDEHGKELIENFVNDVQTMSGRFEQTLVDANDEITRTSTGTFAIRRPGQFRWVYTEPYEQILVADGRNVWSYDVDLAQVTVKPQAEALGSTPASLLGGSEGVLDDFEFAGSFSDRGTVWVRLQPTGGESSFNMVELGFTDGVLTRMILSDNLEQTTLVALYDVALNEDIDPARFQFTPPDDVDLVGTPVGAPLN